MLRNICMYDVCLYFLAAFFSFIAFFTKASCTSATCPTKLARNQTTHCNNLIGSNKPSFKFLQFCSPSNSLKLKPCYWIWFEIDLGADELYDIFGKYGSLRQIRRGNGANLRKSPIYTLWPLFHNCVAPLPGPETRGTCFVVYDDIYDVLGRRYGCLIWSFSFRVAFSGFATKALCRSLNKAKNAMDHLSGFNVAGRSFSQMTFLWVFGRMKCPTTVWKCQVFIKHQYQKKNIFWELANNYISAGAIIPHWSNKKVVGVESSSSFQFGTYLQGIWCCSITTHRRCRQRWMPRANGTRLKLSRRSAQLSQLSLIKFDLPCVELL